MLPSADELLARLGGRTQSDGHGQKGKLGRFRLFLDYDGTLAELARTPEYVEPDREMRVLRNNSTGPRLGPRLGWSHH